MATGPTPVKVAAQSFPGSQEAAVFTWTLAQAEAGWPIEASAFADKSVQVSGVSGGGTIVWEGSNDGVTYGTLTDQAGVAISFAAASAPKFVAEACAFMRPRAVLGDGTTAWAVSLYAKRQPQP